MTLRQTAITFANISRPLAEPHRACAPFDVRNGCKPIVVLQGGQLRGKEFHHMLAHQLEVSQSLSAPASPSVTSEKTEDMSQPAPVTSKSNDDLESENARLKEQRTCKICMDKEVGLTLQSGH